MQARSHREIENSIANKIVGLVMRIIYAMNFYEFTEEFRSELEKKTSNIPSLISHALWVLEHNVKDIMEDKKYQARFQSMKEKIDVDAAIAEIHQFQIDYITSAVPIIVNLENDVFELTQQINKLMNQVSTLTKYVEADQKEKEAKAKETKDEKKSHHSHLFSFSK